MIAGRVVSSNVSSAVLRAVLITLSLAAALAAVRPFFDFRTVSSAEVVALGAGENRRFYMLYEGIRGPGPGDSQFGLGLARSLSSTIDSPWEKFPGNPILVDMPGNIGRKRTRLLRRRVRFLRFAGAAPP